MKLRHAIANSKTSRRSKRPQAAVTISLAVLSAAAALFVHYQGWTLYYGDADAHLMSARRIVDSQNPGLEQLGSVLPLLHLLIAPFARVDDWWQSGIAGAISACDLFCCRRIVFLRRRAADLRFNGRGHSGDRRGVVCAQSKYSLPAIDSHDGAGFLRHAGVALLYVSRCVSKRPEGWLWAAAAGIAACAGELTRYDGWFVLPFAAAYFLIVGNAAAHLKQLARSHR